MSWNWPHTPQNNYVPWWLFVWRLPWISLLVLGHLLCAIAVWGMSFSWSEAVDEFWEGG